MRSRYVKMDQAELLRRCHKGDPGAWEELRNRYRNLVFSVCFRVGLQAEDCPDVIQDTFVALYKSIGSIHTPSALAGWITVTASRQAKRRLAAVRHHVMLDDVEAQAAVEHEDEVLERHDGRDLKLVIDEALSGIPDEWAELVRMHYMEDLSYAEVSQRTGKPLGSIGPTLTRSLSRLRAALPQTLSA